MNFTILDHIVYCMPVFIIIFGSVFNTLAFLILKFTKEFKTMSSMIYLSYLVIVDTMSIFLWNLKHFTRPYFNFVLENVNLFTCRFFPFIQYFSLQASGFLLAVLAVDRFVAIRCTPGSFYSKLPFSTAKSAYFWSFGILTVLFILNSHIFILNGYPNPEQILNRTVLNSANGTLQNVTETYIYQQPGINCYRYITGFRLYPQWDSIHMFLYSFIPASVILVFNLLLIQTTLRDKPSASKSIDQQKSMKRKRKLTVHLLSITFSFIIFTLPTTIAWGFFSDYTLQKPYGLTLLYMLDNISFLNHSSVFFSSILTNYKFRQKVLYYLRRILSIRLELCMSGSTLNENKNKTTTKNTCPSSRT
jgi:hypothetical protein